MPEESSINKTVKGVGWSAVDNVAQYAVSFVAWTNPTVKFTINSDGSFK